MKQEIVLVAESKYLVGYKIFDPRQKPVISIKRNWAHTAALYSAIIDAKFIDNSLYIKYLSGKNFKEEEEFIHYF